MVAVQRDNPDNRIPMTEAEYLAFSETSEVKYEYCQGYAYAMTGGSLRHAAISANVITALNNALRERDCTVASSDLRVQVRNNVYRYPDVSVICSAPEYTEERTDTITNPTVLVEVSSPSTGVIDRSIKLEEYTQLASVNAYVLVSQNVAKIELYARQADGAWLYTNVTDVESNIVIPALDCTLALADVYRKVDFDAE